ncbi:hypothetical protein MNBD_GAMMA07-1194 [hydrothermal vent metagenome]|uniref:Protein N-terminal glutamine amidohydrolase n=1 Tax=hydrothermal vent metagenome TaxID=652676 RepID=A0A3B0XE97_9ZZZZ
MPLFKRSSYTYTQLFCEENVWKLIETLYTNQLAKPIDVLFILNKKQTIALFEQKLSNQKKPVIWDYHVILTAQIEENLMVFDFDSCCEFPVEINHYFNRTFPSNPDLKPTYQAYLKPIKASYYLKCFYSDRAHMQGIVSSDAFPEYDIIIPNSNIEKLTLEQCRNIEQALGLGHFSSTHKILLPAEYLAHIKTN